VPESEFYFKGGAHAALNYPRRSSRSGGRKPRKEPETAPFRDREREKVSSRLAGDPLRSSRAKKGGRGRDWGLAREKKAASSKGRILAAVTDVRFRKGETRCEGVRSFMTSPGRKGCDCKRSALLQEKTSKSPLFRGMTHVGKDTHAPHIQSKRGRG